MTKKRKQAPSSGSLAKNSLLFCVSLSILVGASLLFNNIIHWPNLPLKTAIGNLKTSALIPVKTPEPAPSVQEHKNGAKTSPATADKKEKNNQNGTALNQQEYRYIFYDILTKQKQKNPPHTPAQESSFAIQVGAFKTKKQAVDLKTALHKTKKLDCRILKKGDNNVVVWGSFSTKNAAEHYNRKLGKVLERDCSVVEM